MCILQIRKFWDFGQKYKCRVSFEDLCLNRKDANILLFYTKDCCFFIKICILQFKFLKANSSEFFSKVFLDFNFWRELVVGLSIGYP